MKASELVKTLKEIIELNGDMEVYSIFNGQTDTRPEINVVEEAIYIEGVKEG